MADGPVLVWTHGVLRGTWVPVPEGGLELGRADDNDVVVQDGDVSRYHARLLFDNGSLWVRDAGSRNGIQVNGERVVDHRALRVGDDVALAGNRFQVGWAAPGEEEAEAGRILRDVDPSADPGGTSAAEGDTGADASPDGEIRPDDDTASAQAAADDDAGDESPPRRRLGGKRRWFWPFD